MIDHADDISGRVNDPRRMRLLDRLVVATSLLGIAALWFM